MICMNVSGVASLLKRGNVCSVKDFHQFVIGFNQATPLFTIVDVGYGKEAADAKLKGMWLESELEFLSSRTYLSMGQKTFYSILASIKLAPSTLLAHTMAATSQL